MEVVEEVNRRACSSAAPQSEEEMELRRGPWNVEEDLMLVNYITNHGEGRWNLLARNAGLRRSGKSCRQRWLNYLRPDVRRGNITPEEQLLILELHSLWGNRWSKIARHLPGRTDNEIKNYWRTRVHRHAKLLRCEVNSARFQHLVRHIWMPQLLHRIRSDAKPSPESPSKAVPSPESSFGTAAVEFGCLQGGYEECGGDGMQQQAAELGGSGGWPEALLSPGGYTVSEGLADWEEGEWGGDLFGNMWNVGDGYGFPQQRWETC